MWPRPRCEVSPGPRRNKLAWRLGNELSTQIDVVARERVDVIPGLQDCRAARPNTAHRCCRSFVARPHDVEVVRGRDCGLRCGKPGRRAQVVWPGVAQESQDGECPV